MTLNFKLSLPDGQLIDQTGASGATFKFADGSLLPGFEQALVGLFAGDQTHVTLSSDQGFGAVNEDNIHWMKRSDFARELLLEEGQVWLRAGLVLVLAGAIGNLIDRAALGYVIDFISVHWREYYFPAFNVADASISIGAACLIVDFFKAEGEKA